MGYGFLSGLRLYSIINMKLLDNKLISLLF